MPRPLAKFAGVLPPTTKPSFAVVRKPLWKPNNRTGVADPEGDPITGTNANQLVINHYQTSGNAYLRQPWNALMAWNNNTTPANGGVFAFKCLIKPHEVNGRRLIYSTKGTLDSGGIFVDIMDGRARVGWFDTVAKREVYIETNVPVFEPYHWHYLYVRKRFPDPSLNSAWKDTLFSFTAGETNDVLCVRRFRKIAANPYDATYRTWDYVPQSASRTFIGFTADEFSVPAVPATGLVSRNDRTMTIGGGTGLVTASGAIFSPDHIGKLLVNNIAAVYVITAYTSATQVTIRAQITGATPANDATARAFGVYSGVRLVRSTGYATANAPDTTSYDIELFGSHLAVDAETGVMPFVGEFASFAYTIGKTPGGAGGTAARPGIFEDNNEALLSGIAADDADNGADRFENREIYAADINGVDELHVAGGTLRCFTCVDCQSLALDAAASTVPNIPLEVAVDVGTGVGNVGFSDVTARPLAWKFLSEPINLSKARKVRTAFYDPEQAQASYPSPELSLDLGGEDQSNSSGLASIVLSDLPVSRDKGPIETWVYMTIGDGATFFKVAEVAGGASSVAINKTEAQIASGDVLDFDTFPPPQCDVLEVSQNVLAFGGLRRFVNSDEGNPVDFPDGVAFSKAFNPVAIPGGNLFQVPSGGGERITGMRDFNGKLIVSKDDVIYAARLLQAGAGYERISPGIGCRAHASMLVLDNVLFFLGNKGLYAYSGSGIPRWIGANVEQLFNYGGLARGFAPNYVAAIDYLKHQYVITLRETGRLYTSHRISAQPNEQLRRIVFGRNEGPNLSALGTYTDPLGGCARLVGGTDEGFVVWMDREDTALVMLGATVAVHGDSTLTLAGGSTATKLLIGAGTLDTSLAGARGAVVSTNVGDAVVLFAETGALHLDRALASAPAVQAVTLGKPTRYWMTRWLDFEISESKKRPRFLDVVHTKEGSGTVTVTAYQDFGATAYPLKSLDLAAGFTRVPLGSLGFARFLQFKFSSAVHFEIVELVARVSDSDPY